MTDVLSRPYGSQHLGVRLRCRLQGLTAVGSWVKCARDPYIIPYNCMRVCNYLTVKSLIKKTNVASKKANANSSHNIVLIFLSTFKHLQACMHVSTHYTQVNVSVQNVRGKCSGKTHNELSPDMVSGLGTMDDLSVYISPNCQEPRCSGFVIRKINKCLRCVSKQDAQIRTAQSSQLSKCYFILVAAQAKHSGLILTSSLSHPTSTPSASSAGSTFKTYPEPPTVHHGNPRPPWPKATPSLASSLPPSFHAGPAGVSSGDSVLTWPHNAAALRVKPDVLFMAHRVPRRLTLVHLTSFPMTLPLTLLSPASLFSELLDVHSTLPLWNALSLIPTRLPLSLPSGLGSKVTRGTFPEHRVCNSTNPLTDPGHSFFFHS